MVIDEALYAFRRLCRQPVASVISVTTLACAIAVASVTWSLLSATLLEPLQLKDSARLVQVGFRMPAGEQNAVLPVRVGHSYPAYAAHLQANLMPIAAWGSIGPRTPIVLQSGMEPVPSQISFVSHGFMPLLGLSPSVGRFFSELDDQLDSSLVVVLSDQFWRRKLDADPGVIGKVIDVRDQPAQIIGIAPNGFRGLELDRAPDVFMPLHSIDRVQQYDRTKMFGDRPPLAWVKIAGRLPDRISIDAMTARFRQRSAESGSSRIVVLTDAQTAAIPEAARAGMRQFNQLLTATVALLLLIGTLTVGMLLLLRTRARTPEFSTCLALGASRWRLAAGVALEGATLVSVAAMLALPVSAALFAGIRSSRLPGGIRIDFLDLSIDGRVIAGTLGAAAISVFLMAALAVLVGFGKNISATPRLDSGTTQRFTRSRTGFALVTLQVAVTLVLVTGASLFARSLSNAVSVNPGIDAARLFRVPLDLGELRYDATRASAAFDALRANLVLQPSVASISYSFTIGATEAGHAVLVDGTPVTLPSNLYFATIDASHFDTVGIALSSGRKFLPSDRTGAPRVAIVSESLAKLIGQKGDPAGHRLVRTMGAGMFADPVEIVGVVPDVLWGVDPVEPLRVYLPADQSPVSRDRDIVIRAAGPEVGPSAASLMAALRETDPQIRIGQITTIEGRILEQMAPQRLGLSVLGMLGAVALTLSVMGSYVGAAEMAARRRRELGIRAALGASQHRLRWQLLSATIRLVGVGLLAGFGLSWMAAGTVRAFLFRVEPFDPAITFGVAIGLGLMCVAVSLPPMMSAVRADTARLLREN